MKLACAGLGEEEAREPKAAPQCCHLQVPDSSSALYPEKAAAPALSHANRLALRRKDHGDSLGPAASLLSAGLTQH